ncbi:PepSY domain-containing protein [Faunimonas sp. B44]|uniref:PepSY domain-containing protein n=1 Tax=Faunimonas sp. B44 TaxID=3461493 RepID=UPI004044240E
MKTTAATAAGALLAIIGASAALADSDRPTAGTMTEQAIAQIVAFEGYDVVHIKLDDGIYHVRAYEPSGTPVRLRLDAAYGSILSGDLRHGPDADDRVSLK